MTDHHNQIGRGVLGTAQDPLSDPTLEEVRSLFNAGMDTGDIASFWYGVRALEYRIYNIMAAARAEKARAA